MFLWYVLVCRIGIIYINVYVYVIQYQLNDAIIRTHTHKKNKSFFFREFASLPVSFCGFQSYIVLRNRYDSLPKAEDLQVANGIV